MKSEGYFRGIKSIGEGVTLSGGFIGNPLPKVDTLHDDLTGQSFIVSFEHRKYKETKIGPLEPEIQDYGSLLWKDFS